MKFACVEAQCELEIYTSKQRTRLGARFGTIIVVANTNLVNVDNLDKTTLKWIRILFYSRVLLPLRRLVILLSIHRFISGCWSLSGMRASLVTVVRERRETTVSWFLVFVFFKFLFCHKSPLSKELHSRSPRVFNTTGTKTFIHVE